MISLQVNGEPRSLQKGTTIAALLAELGLRPGLAAVERNGQVVPRARHGEEVLQEGDQVEVVTFVGGG